MDVAGPGKVRPFRFEALRQGWVQTSRQFDRLNDHCGVGDPSRASAEKGRRYLDLVCERITGFLVELARAELDDQFPHLP
jgi:creatinine amidohydrolase